MFDAKRNRLIAFDPSTRGFGFAVFEGKGNLIDWGVVRIASDREFITRAAGMIDRYKPVAVAVEDVQHRHASNRAVRRINAIARYATTFKIALLKRTRVNVLVTLGMPRATKHEIACQIAEIYPEELRVHLPPKRRPWMSEDDRMNIFDAVGLGLSALVPRDSL